MSTKNPFDVLGREEDEVNSLLNGESLFVNVADVQNRVRRDLKKQAKARDQEVPRKQRKDDFLSITYTFLEEDQPFGEKISDKARFRQQMLGMRAKRRAKSSSKQAQSNHPVVVRHIFFVEGGDFEEIVSDIGAIQERLQQIKLETDPLNRVLLDVNFPVLEGTVKEGQTQENSAAVVKAAQVWDPKRTRQLLQSSHQPQVSPKRECHTEH